MPGRVSLIPRDPGEQRKENSPGCRVTGAVREQSQSDYPRARIFTLKKKLPSPSIPSSLYPHLLFPSILPPSLNSTIYFPLHLSFLSSLTNNTPHRIDFLRHEHYINLDHPPSCKLVVLQINSQEFHDLISPPPPSLFQTILLETYGLPGGNSQARKGYEGNGSVLSLTDTSSPFPI